MKNIYICAKKPTTPIIEINNEVDEHDLIIVVPTILFYQFEYKKIYYSKMFLILI